MFYGTSNNAAPAALPLAPDAGRVNKIFAITENKSSGFALGALREYHKKPIRISSEN